MGSSNSRSLDLPFYQIRLAEATDITWLPEIERAAAQQFLPYVDQLEIPPDLLEGLTTQRFLLHAQADERLWVAALSAPVSPTAPCPVVGFIVVKYLPNSCFVVELDVHPDYNRRGIGSALVKRCCQCVRSRGFDRILLTTFRYVPWNIPFYQGLGFEVLTEQFWSPDIKAIVQHEARYGFPARNRAVMAMALSEPGAGAL